MQKISELYKRIKAVKPALLECFGIIKNVDTRLLSTIVAIVMFLSSFGIVTKYYKIGYDVYYGDVNVGVIETKAEAMEAYTEAQTDVLECECDELVYDLSFVMTIASVNAFENSDIYSGIVEAAEGREACVSIDVNGESAARLKTKEEAYRAVELLAKSYGAEVGDVVSEYTISETSEIITKILSAEEAAREMSTSGALVFVHVEETVKETEIAFEEIKEEDPTLAKGLNVVVQEGVAGKKTEKTVTVFENGKETEKSNYEQIDAEPVNRVVRVGTGDMVGLSEKSLPWPVDGTFTSEFGKRWGRNHNGVDIAAKTGTYIYAPCSGKVVFADTKSGYGNYVIIDHGNGYETTYAHMNSINVSLGQKVSVGDVVGTVGTTGRVTGAHLHFEVLKDGTYTDPMKYIAG